MHLTSLVVNKMSSNALLPSPSISIGVISVENLEDIEVKSLDEYIWIYMFG